MTFHTLPTHLSIQTHCTVQINFLAIDFDQTMINIHTGGRWKGTTAELNGMSSKDVTEHSIVLLFAYSINSNTHTQHS